MAKRDFSKAEYTKQLHATLEKGEMIGNAVTAVDVKIDKIDENPDNEMIFNMGEIERLANSIEKNGFQGAIEIYKKEDGRYEISSGHRRYRAMKLLKRTTIPAIVKSAPDEVQRRKSLIGGNINNRDMKPMDWARAIFYQRNTYYIEDAIKHNRELERNTEGFLSYQPVGNVIDKLTADFGMSQSTIKRFIRLNKLIPEIAEYIDKGYVSAAAVVELSEFPPDEQLQFFKALQREWQMQNSEEDDTKMLSKMTTARIINAEKARMRSQEIFEQGLNRESILLSQMPPEQVEVDSIENVSPETDSNFFAEKNPVKSMHQISAVSQELPPIEEHITSTDFKIEPFGEAYRTDASHEKKVTFRRPIDGSLVAFADQLANICQPGYEIENLETVENTVKKIEELLAELKTKF